jgi:hypothetical protein
VPRRLGTGAYLTTAESSDGLALVRKADQCYWRNMSHDVTLGVARTTLTRSLRSVVLGFALLSAIVAALVAWNLIRRPGSAGIAVSFVIAGAAIPGFLVFASAPHTVVIYDMGILVRALFRRPIRLVWSDIVSAEVWAIARGPGARILTIRGSAPRPITIHEAQYPAFEALVGVLMTHVAERLKDSRT